MGSDVRGVPDSSTLRDPFWPYVVAYLPLVGEPGCYASLYPSGDPHQGDNLTDRRGGHWGPIGSPTLMIPGPLPVVSALYNASSGSYLVPLADATPSWNIGSGVDFTVETHVFLAPTSSTSLCIFGSALSWSSGAWVLQLNRTGANGYLSVLVYSGGSQQNFAALANGVTYHLALERYASSWYVYINGQSSMTPFSNGSALLASTGAIIANQIGYLWNFRMTVGAARYSSVYGAGASFVAPSGATLYPVTGP